VFLTSGGGCPWWHRPGWGGCGGRGRASGGGGRCPCAPACLYVRKDKSNVSPEPKDEPNMLQDKPVAEDKDEMRSMISVSISMEPMRAAIRAATTVAPAPPTHSDNGTSTTDSSTYSFQVLARQHNFGMSRNHSCKLRQLNFFVVRTPVVYLIWQGYNCCCNGTFR
jgi:hypothetical protein